MNRHGWTRILKNGKNQTDQTDQTEGYTGNQYALDTQSGI